ncbi:Hypothetical protein CINCED_3A004389 [Cinara cedri]|uniref:Harbinger transposase-derived nuclease domain n=1 Tax=Cinara cedri TaxID=506608 RepID=A0A5E4MIG0_9HEMI|nr:Hypothetical protein CINCED_3A004389 [Cinara cedri]
MQRRQRIFRERVIYMELFDHRDLMNRFRPKKRVALSRDRWKLGTPPPSQRNKAILAPCKLYTMPRYLATGSFLLTVADFTGVSESSACRYIDQVCRAISRCFGVLKQRLPVLSKGITANIINTQVIIVACGVIYNICINIHNKIPNGALVDKKKDALIRDHFANL